MITSDIFNSLKEGDTLYVILYYKNKVKKIKVSTVGLYCIGTEQGYNYNNNDNERLYLNKKDCYVDYIKHLQKSNIDNKKLEKFNRFIKNNIEYFI